MNGKSTKVWRFSTDQGGEAERQKEGTGFWENRSVIKALDTSEQISWHLELSALGVCLFL